ncbi:MAG: PaaI family thioesterase [Streptosporangiaceae bacterium]
MLDDTLGPALAATLPEGQFAPTLELKVSFLRPAAPGRFTGTGRVVHRGGSIAFLAGAARMRPVTCWPLPRRPPALSGLNTGPSQRHSPSSGRIGRLRARVPGWVVFMMVGRPGERDRRAKPVGPLSRAGREVPRGYGTAGSPR